MLRTLALTLLLALPASAQDPVQKAQPGPFALVGCRAVTVSGGVVENATLVLRDGRIAEMGAGLAAPAGAQTVDCAGRSVYPGMIDSGTQIGLVEVNSDPRTRDFDEIGSINPNVQALTAVNPNSVWIPVTRVSGVTTAVTMPSGGLLPGEAAVVNLHGYTPEQMLVSPAARMQTMQFPAGGRRGGWDRRSDEDIEKDYNEAVGELDELWDEAERYVRIDSARQAAGSPRPTQYVPELDALAQVVRGEMKLMIEVNRAGDITNALEWAEGRGLTGQVILAGCAEGWRVAEAIAEAGVPCLVGPVLAVPTRESDRYDRAYANPGLMQRAGVRVAIRSTDGNGNYRNLPYHAGFAAAYGMGRDAALYAVTLGAAQILGIDDRVGSLEVGKEATLFLADGDPFETGTDVTEVFIQGYRMPMATRQTRLYREFLDRQPGLTETPDGSLR
jgi:imidazolonepropionase-like amidohydrolase